MDYVFVVFEVMFIAISFGLTKFYQRRFVKGIKEVLLFPFIAAIVSALFFIALNGLKLSYGAFTVYIALFNALVSVTTIMLGIYAMRYGKMFVYTVFMMLGGMMLPYFFGILFLKEIPSVYRIIGLIILIGALLLTVIKKKNGNQKSDKTYLILCTAIFFLNGCISILSKVHQVNFEALPAVDFLIWNSLFSIIFLSIIFIFFIFFRLFKNDKKEINQKLEVVKTNFIFSSSKIWFPLFVIIGYALATGTGFLFQLIAAETLPAVVLFPMITGGTILFNTLSSKIFFKEEISKLTLISLLITLFGTILFLF